MADTVMLFPVEFADHSTLNQSQLVMQGELTIRLGERLSILPYVDLVMIGGQGTQVIRRPNWEHLGNTTPTALAGTTDEPVAVDRTIGYDDVTTAPHGLAVGQTFDDQMFSLPDVARISSYEQLMSEIPGSADALMVSLACAALTGISASVGSSATAMSLDTVYAAKANFNAQYPSDQGRPPPLAFLHATALEHLEQSARSEPGMVQNGMGLAAQTFHTSQIFPNLLGLGITAIKTSKVNTSGGALQNAIVDVGGIAIGVGDTGRIQIPPGLVQAMTIPMMGLIAFADARVTAQRTNRLVAFFYQGASMRDSNVFRQVRLLSAPS